MTDPKGNDFIYTYDGSHNIETATSAANVKYTFTYDGYGNPTETMVVNPDDEDEYIRSTAGYTSNGNYQISVTDALGKTSQSTYNEEKGLLTKSTDANGNTTEYTYDNMERLTGVSAVVGDGTTVNADGTAQVTYAYEDDSLKSITHNGFAYEFGTDGFGNTTSVSVAGTELVDRTYGADNGNLLSETYANGATYLYSYDEFDRVVQISLKDSEGTESVLYRYAYDNEGNLAVTYDIREDIGEDTITTRYFYDLSGRLVHSTTDSGESYRYEYDLNNNLTKNIQKNPYRTLETIYTYDKDSRETSVTAGAAVYDTEYDALGRIEEQTWEDGTVSTTRYVYAQGAGGSQSSQVEKVIFNNQQTSYTYDANGNIKSITDPYGKVTAYAYDELNQLIREDNENQEMTVVYAYDTGGNIKEKRIYSYQPDASADELVQMTPADTIAYGYDATWKDKLVSYDGENITYDELSNPLSYRGMTFTWEKARELGSITKDGTTYSYRYNEDGMRISKTVSDGVIYYQVEGDLLVSEWKIKNGEEEPEYQLEFVYDSAGSPIALLLDGTEYYYKKNLQGDIIGIIDGLSEWAAKYEYDSWGNLIQIKTPSAAGEIGYLNPLRYRGYYYDSETGFYYVSSRYYDPEIGRFINADSAISGVGGDVRGYNMYSYCFNNPVNMSDPTGDWPKWVETAAKVVSVAVAVVAVGVLATQVAAVAAGTLVGAAAGKAVFGAAVAVGAALSGINGAVANSKKGNSYFNGYVGGATGGLIQGLSSKTPQGVIAGGGIGVTTGTFITDALNNIDPDSSNSSARQMMGNALSSGGKALITSSMTAGVGAGVGGVNYHTGVIEGAVANGCGGLMPTLTLGFGEGIKAFFGWSDDAVIYLWE